MLLETGCVSNNGGDDEEERINEDIDETKAEEPDLQHSLLVSLNNNPMEQ